MSIVKEKRNVQVPVIHCDREGCESTVAPEHEETKGWFFFLSVEATKRQAMQINFATDAKAVCPTCAVAVKAAMASSAVITRSAEHKDQKICIGKDGRCAEFAEAGSFLCIDCGGNSRPREEVDELKHKAGRVFNRTW